MICSTTILIIAFSWSLFQAGLAPAAYQHPNWVRIFQPGPAVNPAKHQSRAKALMIVWNLARRPACQAELVVPSRNAWWYQTGLRRVLRLRPPPPWRPSPHSHPCRLHDVVWTSVICWVYDRRIATVWTKGSWRVWPARQRLTTHWLQRICKSGQNYSFMCLWFLGFSYSKYIRQSCDLNLICA